MQNWPFPSEEGLVIVYLEGTTGDGWTPGGHLIPRYAQYQGGNETLFSISFDTTSTEAPPSGILFVNGSTGLPVAEEYDADYWKVRNEVIGAEPSKFIRLEVQAN